MENIKCHLIKVMVIEKEIKLFANQSLTSLRGGEGRKRVTRENIFQLKANVDAA